MSQSTLYNQDNSAKYSVPFAMTSKNSGGSDLPATAFCYMPAELSTVDGKTTTAGSLAETDFDNAYGFYHDPMSEGMGEKGMSE